MASFVSSYTLAVGYVILLYFVGKVRSEVLPQSRDFASERGCLRTYTLDAGRYLGRIP